MPQGAPRGWGAPPAGDQSSVTGTPESTPDDAKRPEFPGWAGCAPPGVARRLAAGGACSHRRLASPGGARVGRRRLFNGRGGRREAMVLSVPPPPPRRWWPPPAGPVPSVPWPPVSPGWWAARATTSARVASGGVPTPAPCPTPASGWTRLIPACLPGWPRSTVRCWWPGTGTGTTPVAWAENATTITARSWPSPPTQRTGAGVGPAPRGPGGPPGPRRGRGAHLPPCL